MYREGLGTRLTERSVFPLSMFNIQRSVKDYRAMVTELHELHESDCHFRRSHFFRTTPHNGAWPKAIFNADRELLIILNFREK